MKRILVLLFTASMLQAAPAGGEIERHFAEPPADARMASYWWSFGPAWTRDEVRRELGILAKAGIGRVLVYPLYPFEVDDPARGIRNLNYLSPEFLEMLRHVLATARENGLEADLVMGTGWPYGGPMIPQSLSPRRIYVQSAPVRGAAGRRVTMRLEPLGPEEERIAVQLVPKSPGAAIDVTPAAGAGEVAFTIPQGEWELMTFVQGFTTERHTVAYAAAGAGGNVIDHLDPRAVELYLKEVGSKLASVAKGQLRALYCPSMEVNGTSWTPAFLKEFRQRRGYDIKPHLSALFRDEGETSRHIRHDYWDTVQELAIANYVTRVGDWVRSQGLRFQAESYGTPPVRMNTFQAVDCPMGEDEDWKQFNRTRWASSAAHYFGRRIVSVEAFTGLQRIRYSESLQDLKIGADLHYLAGANRLVMHGYAYSPPVAGIPGWGYYAGIMASEHNTWWPYFPLFSKYAQRSQYLLSQGVPVSDVALYLPEDDVFADMPPGYINYIHVKYRMDRTKRRLGDNFGLDNALAHETDVVKTILTSGFTLDGIDHSILSGMGTVKNGRFEIGDASLGVLVLPGIRGLPLEDMERIAEFCRNGGTVIATMQLPQIAYGYRDRERNAARFKTLVEELWGVDVPRGYSERSGGKGRAIFSPDEKEGLRKALQTAEPDMQNRDGLEDIGFVHRRAGSQDFYFVVNLTPRERVLQASFRIANRAPRIWDPMTGAISETADYRAAGSRTEVTLRLEPWGSRFVEFGSARRSAGKGTGAGPGGPVYTAGGHWTLSWPGGAPVRMDALKSWTEQPDMRFFSGKAAYETSIELSKDLFVPRARLVLDLGEVHEIADVSINGKPAGVAWKLPYQLDVTGQLRPGRNTLRIEVSNLLINRVLNQPDKDYSAVEAKYKVRIPRAQEKSLLKEPLPSGLLGPVRIRQIRP